MSRIEKILLPAASVALAVFLSSLFVGSCDTRLTINRFPD